jgi:hypothetical protein
VNLDELLKQLGHLQAPTKRSIFVSYHHSGDRAFYDAFSGLFADKYEVLQDNSVEREIDSENVEYVYRRIREDYITGSSCTIVLCGADTPNRKFVDWEINSTLEKEHGLIGVNLPTNPVSPNGKVSVPVRLLDNIQSGYAVWTSWETLKGKPQLLGTLIEQATAKDKPLIRNDRELRPRNG